MGLISTVGLVLHPRRNCQHVTDVITRWARSRNARVIGMPEEVARIDGEVTAVEPESLAEDADLIISLGGDGTMLRAMRLSCRHGTPILGVNLGRLGFLAEIDVPELDGALCAIDDHRFTVEPRSGLRATADGLDTVAFNDVALARVPGHGMAVIELMVEGHPFVRYAADAVVVATPTGSTAYSFSAGGPIVSPNAEGLLVTPVAPHSAFNRALFLSPDEKLLLRILPTSGDIAVEADGRLIGRLRPGDVIDLAVLSAAAGVVRLGQTTFYQRAQRRLRLMGSAEADPEIDAEAGAERAAGRASAESRL